MGGKSPKNKHYRQNFYVKRQVVIHKTQCLRFGSEETVLFRNNPGYEKALIKNYNLPDILGKG